MPISMSVNHKQHTVHAEAVGEISYDEIVEHLHRERDARGIPYREVIDATRATAAFDSSDARRLVSLVRQLGQENAFGPTAVVVGNDLTYGMLRMLEILLDDVADVRPFRSGERRDAEAWVATVPARPKAT